MRPDGPVARTHVCSSLSRFLPHLVGRVEAKPLVVEPPKMEAEKELEIVNELIENCEADLKVKDCDEKALTMTLLSLKKRRAAAQVCCVEPPS